MEYDEVEIMSRGTDLWIEGKQEEMEKMAREKIVSAFLVAFFNVFLQGMAANDFEEFYEAAVVEFASSRKQEDNLEAYEWFIKKTKEDDVDIIVFPENTLHGVDGDIEKKLSEVPNPGDKIIPCRHKEYKKWMVLERLSCAAQESAMYTVVNLLERVPCNASHPGCPGEGRMVYNTNVVFDRAGTIISRYRKHNLHDEYFVTKTDQADFEVFVTDFGVRFGVITSFDILFQTPALDLVDVYNITNFVCPTYWYGELPFFTALQIQSGWSYSTNVNLLAAGATKPMTGTGGSGIYVGRRGPTVFTMSEKEESAALISRVPKNNRFSGANALEDYQAHAILLDNKENESGSGVRFQLQRDPTIPNFESVLLNESENDFQRKVCSGVTLCCDFSIRYQINSYAKDKSYSYRAVAYQGYKHLSKDVQGAVETCAIILCTGPNIEDCGKRPNPSSNYYFIFDEISIEARFGNNQTFQMPNILLGSGRPDKKTKLVLSGSGNYHFQTEEEENSRRVILKSTKELKRVITFGIYGRDFGKSEAFAPHSALLLLIPLIFVAIF